MHFGSRGKRVNSLAQVELGPSWRTKHVKNVGFLNEMGRIRKTPEIGLKAVPELICFSKFQNTLELTFSG